MATMASHGSSRKSTGHTLIRLPCFFAIVIAGSVGLLLTEWYFPEEGAWKHQLYSILLLGFAYLIMRIIYHGISDHMTVIHRHVWGMIFYATASVVLLLIGLVLGPSMLSRYGEEHINFFFIISVVSSTACFVLNFGHHLRGYYAKRN